MAVIYIASPYTIGDQARNVLTQITAAHRILDMGHAPIAPLLSHFLHIHKPRPYDDWIAMCLALVPKSDVVLRLPGKSAGADREATLARDLGIPLAAGWDDLALVLDLRGC